MSALILPRPISWFDMVSPHIEEVPEFLKKAGIGWRTPMNKRDDMWRLRAGEFRGPRRQRGFMRAVGFWQEPAGDPPSGTEPDLSAFTHHYSVLAPTVCRISVAYDSDGTIEADLDAAGLTTIVYVTMTTQSDDSNNHSLEWWPDLPETNEGLNWDIRFTGLTETGVATARWYFYDTSGAAQRVEDTWYLLDTVSNDHLDGSAHGALGINRNNGTSKNPDTGTAKNVMTVEIRATGSGSAVASHTLTIEVTGT